MPATPRKLSRVSPSAPHAPLTLDLLELSRRPGSMRQVDLTVAAPADLSLGGVIGVPEGADLKLDLRLEAVMEGVLVSGTARAPITGECARCLDPLSGELEVEVQELYAYPGSVTDEVAEDVDEVALRVEDDQIDLEPAVRDAVVLALPAAPLCREECAGLCAQCGARLDDDPDHAHENTDPRWAALQGLFTQNPSSEPGPAGAGPTKEN